MGTPTRHCGRLIGETEKKTNFSHVLFKRRLLTTRVEAAALRTHWPRSRQTSRRGSFVLFNRWHCVWCHAFLPSLLFPLHPCYSQLTPYILVCSFTFANTFVNLFFDALSFLRINLLTVHGQCYGSLVQWPHQDEFTFPSTRNSCILKHIVYHRGIAK